MMMPHEKKRKINTLILKLLENSISDQEIQELNELFLAYPELINYYCDFVINYNAVRIKYNNERGLTDVIDSGDSIDRRLWDALADEEKTAPIVEIPAVQKDPERKITGLHKKQPKVSKFSIYSLLLSSAALIFVMVYAFFISMRRGIEVATLADSMNAQWADAASSLERADE
jgi:hypothetical protein